MDTLSLPALRAEIDRIDAALHDLILARADLLGRVAAAKRAGPAASAFRPERELAVMRALAERHHGPLPLAAVESMWRILVATSTFVQSRFAVRIVGTDPDLRDSARFHFGFSVPLHVGADVPSSLDALAASPGDLVLVPIGPAAEPWWRRLEAPHAPKVIARLPFLPRPDHPAGIPLLVVAARGVEGDRGEGVGTVALSARKADVAEAWEVLASSPAAPSAILAAAPRSALLSPTSLPVGTMPA